NNSSMCSSLEATTAPTITTNSNRVNEFMFAAARIFAIDCRYILIMETKFVPPNANAPEEPTN
ncbi:hypothetical protein QZH41_020115, partial [Actinostola sp. cb2023]